MLSSFLQWKDREQRSSSIQRSAFKGQEKDASVYSKGNFVHVEGKKKAPRELLSTGTGSLKSIMQSSFLEIFSFTRQGPKQPHQTANCCEQGGGLAEVSSKINECMKIHNYFCN